MPKKETGEEEFQNSRMEVFKNKGFLTSKGFVLCERSEPQTQAGVEHAPCGYVEGGLGQQSCLDFAPFRWPAETDQHG